MVNLNYIILIGEQLSFIKNTKKAIISFFSDIRIYRGGIILFGDSSYQVKGTDMRSVLNMIKPGDIILRRYDHYLGTLFIPGYFSHSAMYLGDNIIIHMLGEGINKEDILTFIRCDAICILRCQDAVLINNAIIESERLWNNRIQYDYNFDFKSDDYMTCTEFINHCFGGLFKNKKIIIPDDFLNSIFNVEFTTKR